MHGNNRSHLTNNRRGPKHLTSGVRTLISRTAFGMAEAVPCFSGLPALLATEAQTRN